MKKNKNEQIIFYGNQGDILKQLPIYEGGVSAGFPSPADDYLDMDLNLHKYLVKNPVATFFIIAKGVSMEKAGINDEDLLVVDKSLNAKNNDIVVAIVNGEFTVKKYIVKDQFICIRAESNTKNYPDITITDEIEFEIWGVVTHTIQSNR